MKRQANNTQVLKINLPALEYLLEHHFDAALAVVFVTWAVYYSREELYSQGRFTWTNIGLEFTWTELELGLLIECVFLVLHYITGFSLQGGFIWYTCCLLIGLVLCVFIVAVSIKAKLASQNETLSSEDRSANQGENAGPSPGQTITAVAGNEDELNDVWIQELCGLQINLPTWNEASSPEDRSSSRKGNEGPSPGQSHTSDTIDGVVAKRAMSDDPENHQESQEQSEDAMRTNDAICDIIILHTDDGRKKAYKFKNHLQSELSLGDVKVDVIDEIGAGEGRLSLMERVYNTYRYIFLYLTADFKEDCVITFNSESILVSSLEELSSKGRVVPIWPSKDTKNNGNFPQFIRTLTAIQYYDYFDESCKDIYIKKMERLISNGRKTYLKN